MLCLSRVTLKSQAPQGPEVIPAPTHMGVNHRGLVPEKLGVGDASANCPPDFVIIPLRIHQNTRNVVQKHHFFLRDGTMPVHISPLLSAKPLELTISSFQNVKQIYADKYTHAGDPTSTEGQSSLYNGHGVAYGLYTHLLNYLSARPVIACEVCQ